MEGSDWPEDIRIGETDVGGGDGGRDGRSEREIEREESGRGRDREGGVE